MPLNINFQQILLHLFNFVILFGVLYFLLYKPVKDFMEKRRQGYEDMEKETKDNLAKAEALKQEYENKLAQAEADAAELRSKTMDQAEAEREKIIDQANEKADEIVKKAHVKAEADAEIIKSQTKNEIASYVSELADKLVADSEEEAYKEFFEAAGTDK